MIDTGGTVWPKDSRGDFLDTCKDPVTGLEMCRDCRNGCHAKAGFGCKVAKCQCRCYNGRNKGLAKVREPHISLRPDLLGDVEAIKIP